MKENILIVLPSDDIHGGAEGVLYTIAKYLVSRYSLYVVFLLQREHNYWSQLEESGNCKILDTKGLRERDGVIGLWRNLYGIRAIKFKYAFTSHTHMTFIVGLMKQLNILQIKSFIGRENNSRFLLYNYRLPMFWRLQYQLGFPACNLLICQTNAMVEQFYKGMPHLATKLNIQCLPNPICIEDIMLASQEATSIPLSSEYQYIVSAGRFIETKGFSLLIKSFANLKEKSRFKLVILGDGILRDQLTELTRALGISDHVLFPGMVDNVYPYFRSAYMCVVSSKMEGFPNVLLQMISQCDRVVSTLCAGDIDKISGLVTCPPGDEKALSEAMEYAISMPLSGIRESFDSELKTRDIEGFFSRCELLCSEEKRSS